MHNTISPIKDPKAPSEWGLQCGVQSNSVGGTKRPSLQLQTDAKRCHPQEILDGHVMGPLG